jgi:hypothetical protein
MKRIIKIILLACCYIAIGITTNAQLIKMDKSVSRSKIQLPVQREPNTGIITGRLDVSQIAPEDLASMNLMTENNWILNLMASANRDKNISPDRISESKRQCWSNDGYTSYNWVRNAIVRFNTKDPNNITYTIYNVPFDEKILVTIESKTELGAARDKINTIWEGYQTTGFFYQTSFFWNGCLSISLQDRLRTCTKEAPTVNLDLSIAVFRRPA